MIVGNKKSFAIEAQPQELVGSWLFGRFRFWLCGVPVGNWEDAADLKGCARWLREFSEDSRNRYEQGLFELSAEEVFSRIYDPVMPRGVQDEAIPQVEDAYSRFHISHLGMSSFERFDILLLKDECGAERCLWREVSCRNFKDCRLDRDEMERVAREFCDCFELLGEETPDDG